MSKYMNTKLPFKEHSTTLGFPGKIHTNDIVKNTNTQNIIEAIVILNTKLQTTIVNHNVPIKISLYP
jgi:hypothetical protein